MSRLIGYIAAVSLAFFGSGAEAATNSCGSGGMISGADGNLFRPYQERTLTTKSGDERKWLLRLPSSYEEGTPADVVFLFHGATSTAERVFEYTDFEPLADRDGVILVMPDANKVFYDQSHELASYWNSAWEAKWRERDHDVDFVLELVELIKTDYCAGDFYTAGMSAGGDMTTALQCLADSPFLSYAPVTYRYYNEDECKNAPPRPMLSFHGSDDKVVPLEGLDAPWFDAHMSVIMQSWAEHNRCDPQSIEERVSDEVMHYRWNNCEAATEWYLIEGGGHTWPGNDVAPIYGHSTRDISATELIWKFFFEY